MTSSDRADCRNCTTHDCGLLYAECPCCAAHAGEPGDVTLGAASASLPMIGNDGLTDAERAESLAAFQAGVGAKPTPAEGVEARVTTALMTAMGCKVEDDVPECPNCDTATCQPHGLIYYCIEHDWHESDNAPGVCGYAVMLARTVLAAQSADAAAAQAEALGLTTDRHDEEKTT